MYRNLPTSRGKGFPYEKHRCHRCRGNGDAPCGICAGSGAILKSYDPNGHPVFGKCDGCLGRRVVRCPTCGGERFI